MDTDTLTDSTMPSTPHSDLPGTPAVFRSKTEVPTQNQSHLDEDLRSLLQALPTSAHIEALILRIEEAHSRDLTEMRADLHTLADRVANGESSISSLENRVQALEHAQEIHAMESQEMQLHLEEMEDRSRRNILRLRGIPEAIGPEDLAETVTAIFLRLLETPPPSLEIDRVHRTLGPKSADLDRPRDVLCRLHRYSQKENILRKA